MRHECCPRRPHAATPHPIAEEQTCSLSTRPDPHVGRVDANIVAARVALDGGARLLEADEVAGQHGDPRALPRRGRGHGERAAGPARDEDVAAFERDTRGAGPREECERGE